jgi:hypothetical protein
MNRARSSETPQILTVRRLLVLAVLVMLITQWPYIKAWIREGVLPGIEQSMWRSMSRETGWPPPPSFVRVHARGLGLGTGTRAALARLSARCNRDLAPVSRQRDAAASRLLNYRGDPNSLAPFSLSDLKRHRDSLGLCVGQMARIRTQYWYQQQRLLTRQQQEKALALWRRDRPEAGGGK